jgi:integral membrane protein
MVMNTVLRRFASVAFFEGISCVLLFLVAMPLKYLTELEWAPRFSYWVGMSHGVLVIAYILLLFISAQKAKWSLKTIALYLVASLIPFATFWVEKKVLKEAKSYRTA